MNRKRVLVLGALFVAALLVLGVSAFGAVNGEKEASAKPVVAKSTTTGAPATTTTVTIPTSPLTGIPQPDGAARTKPALIVKVDDAPEARPQFGIDKADVIYEEKVEGGLSRFMTVFQSQGADQVGPVRSLRSTDIFVARPLGGALMGFSGGIQPFKNMLPSSNLVDVSNDRYGSIYSRMAGRPYVHSLYTSTAKLWSLAPPGEPAPHSLFTFNAVGAAFNPAGATALKSVSGHLSGTTSFDWAWDATSGTWKRATDGKVHNLTNGQLSTNNVIIQWVPYTGTPYTDPAHNPVDEASLQGTGDSWVLSQGKLVPGRWVRPTLDQPTVYNDAAGNPINLTPGRTFVELIPVGQPVAINN